MKAKHQHVYVVRSKRPPTVELDTEAGAAYIRFADGKIARTEVQDDNDVLVTFDLDENGAVLGAELIGVNDFTLNSLIARIPSLKNPPKGEARYIAAPKLQSA